MDLHVFPIPIPPHLPLHPIPLGLPSAPGPSTCLMHRAWAGDLLKIKVIFRGISDLGIKELVGCLLYSQCVKA